MTVKEKGEQMTKEKKLETNDQPSYTQSENELRADERPATVERISALGPEGTFSHQAALILDKNAEILFEKTIRDVFERVSEGEAEKGVVPIENSISGSVGFTLDALLDFDLTIEQEEIVPVIHSLMAKACPELAEGTKKTCPEPVERVYAHEQTYSQCEGWIRKNLPEAEYVETASNGQSAKIVSENGKGSAAIGPLVAAEIYGLKVLEKNIQDNRFNVTRFIVISKNKTKPTGYDRTSITIYPQIDRPGLLHDLLGYFKENNVNLSKIESRPSKGKLGDYVFYVDLQGHIEDENVKEALSEVEKVAFVKILGSYPRKY
ncbi:MAG: prephenate dehydratase [Patescibacteria group bacterium]|nr:prephenate dehydratase [Patescibacteria group bacterium]